MLKLAGRPCGVGAWMIDTRWMREGHYASVEVDDSGGSVYRDSKPSLKLVDLVDVVREGGKIRGVQLVCFTESKFEYGLTMCWACSCSLVCHHYPSGQ